MTTKPKVKKFRIRRRSTLIKPQEQEAIAAGKVAPPAAPEPVTPVEPTDDAIAAIGREGLTGRQLRMARRVAQKNGISVTSDYDAVFQLRQAGIDPFQRNSVLELVKGEPTAAPKAQPKPAPKPSAPAAPNNRHMNEVASIQRDIARRRRRKLALLFTRLCFFVFLPTAIVGWYYFNIATPMYATKSEIVIQQAQAQGPSAGGLAGLFQGTSMATQQDSIAVQSYLASREAMLRLDADHGFKEHFSDPAIDEIQRLPEGATNEEAYKLYMNHVQISYDPTEGIIRMEVISADPAKSTEFSEALISYAEEQVDQLTSRLRDDQMAGARESYEVAERQRADALAQLLRIQEDFQQIDVAGETSARMSQIASLESERQRLDLILQSRLNVARPSALQVESLRAQIANIDSAIEELRAGLTVGTNANISLAARNTELRTAEENYSFRVALVQQALTQMETARIEANRQVRYLSQSVRPIAPDEATYPRKFENTLLAFFIFSGIYLMFSLTASVLREQVSS
ncbi:capsule biosynthesis protein [Yoonia sediminilitoris]|uniref:Capsular polysaccharide transport system permease protein n=1 Tax=Yoonia sediminilitoris TaxID=1286148 RepID=A0A2T6KKD4_9RHOB|nr:capsule biosynthesis protein [Yoonia sediminilitoris]PUB16427.1 capsular polysaccharide transport system permease protein [Yoonia sediminilitoris]RCW96776.1 capsular polysaccharide transport system permease protein [Yoonia sediminilitoris]